MCFWIRIKYYQPLIKNIFLFFLFPVLFHAQDSQSKKFSQLSAPEKRWAIIHPFCAVKIKKLSAGALLIVNEVAKNNLLDKFENGGKQDAFRHVFTMAFLAQKIKIKKLRKLGIAHEKGNYLQFKKGILENAEPADSLSCEMDLRNNEIGFLIGKENKNISSDSLKKIILNKIENKFCWTMLRNEKGNYLTCEGKEIILAEWKGKWCVPKCLKKD